MDARKGTSETPLYYHIGTYISNVKKMNRITHLFEIKKRGILSVYFMAGYPRLNDTANILKTLEAKGIDMVEVGIPFSDPMADGPVIQEASTRALRNGMTLRLLFEQLKDCRPQVHIPIILMGYLNPIMQFGFENFCRKCAETGIDGVIIPDLPFADYIEEYKPLAEQHGLKVIMLITPETSPERIRLIDEHTSGFIYMVSSAAITGAQKSFDEQKQAYFRRINDMHLNNPRLVGFGISNKATCDAAAAYSSGAITGSRFIQLLTSEATVEQAVDKLLNDLK
jgi:tryptophan synthase alpha chain